MLYAMPPPEPPRVNAGRMISGSVPMSAAIASASASVSAVPLGGTCRPMRSIASLKSSLSSALLMASSLAPMSSTPNSASVPSSESALARFSAVCPPIVGRMASGRSLRMISRSAAGVSGTTYVTSAVSGSVMMVAGLLLASTTR